ncbi:hypothetical protein [Streptomyces sp. MST-110588]|uniref:hypothetical protein n=1 Tax=Streptomyces sp. MST-110588 TaxID=2833628 RepID=UPI001F5D7CEC|nr:hypothetical protein [Streptomyces sp. MST-110588]UNO43536.1 hypothetical protein KGS77_33750 [Streptomyces sp. MST-110588]
MAGKAEIITGDPGLVDRLEEEAFHDLPGYAPFLGHELTHPDQEAADAGEGEGDGSACELSGRGRVLATAVIREERPVAWAELIATDEGHELRYTLAAREADRIRGDAPGAETTAEEFALVRALAGELLDFARANGVSEVFWTDDEADLSARLAARCHAAPFELHRVWSTVPSVGAAASVSVTSAADEGVRTAPEPLPVAEYVALFSADPVLGGRPWTAAEVADWHDVSHMGPGFRRLTVDAIDAQGGVRAQLPCDIADVDDAADAADIADADASAASAEGSAEVASDAFVRHIPRSRIEPGHLARALAFLALELRSRYPSVRTLHVYEEDDTLAQALAQAGLVTTARRHGYRLTL